MDEVSAAMGLTNLESLEQFVAVNRGNYEQYRAELEGIDGLSLVSYDEKETNNFQYIVLEVDESRTVVTRDQLVQILHAENVLARRYFYPGCHRMEPYRSETSGKGSSLLETERLANRVLCLPTGTTISTRDITEVCGLLRYIVGNGKQLKSMVGQNVV
jgi:dTDP-4-amino-4,6-dideoxygalactose transaminase